MEVGKRKKRPTVVHAEKGGKWRWFNIKKNSITNILWKFGFHCAILCISQSAFGKILKVGFRLLKK